MLTLNGDGAGPVNNFTVMSQVAPSYAPAGKQLISVSVLGTQELTEAQLSGFVIAQMKNWFGVVARSWQLAPKVDVVGSEMVFVGYGIVAPEFDWVALVTA